MYKLCKTEQSATRQRELEQKLVEIMNVWRYEEISVSDFCAFAGIPRKAFYRYFSSKDGALYALLDHTMLEYEGFRQPDLVGSGGAESLMKDMESFFRFWKERKSLLDGLANSGLSGVLMERAINNVSHGARQIKLMPGETSRMRSYEIQFTVCGIMIMVINWHHSGYQESVHEMASIAMRLISEPLIPSLKAIR